MFLKTIRPLNESGDNVFLVLHLNTGITLRADLLMLRTEQLLLHSTIYSIIRSHFGSSHSGGVQTHLRAMWANFGDKTEEAGLNFVYSLMQEMKFLKQQFQQQDLHLFEPLAAIEAHLTLQQQRLCNLEQAAARGQLDPLVLNDPWTTTLNQAPMPPKLLAVKAPPPYLGQLRRPVQQRM